MACRNIVTVPVMSQTLLNVLFDSQLAAHEKLNEDAQKTDQNENHFASISKRAFPAYS